MYVKRNLTKAAKRDQAQEAPGSATMSNTRMLVDLVDEQDVPAGVIAREDLAARSANFRVVHAFVFNSRGHLLLQKLPANHPRHPGYWGSSIAGYVSAGESYRQAIERKAAEELRAGRLDLHFSLKTSMKDLGGTKFIELFVALSDGPFRPDASQIEALEFLSPELIEDYRHTGARRFTPTFLHLWDCYQARERA